MNKTISVLQNILSIILIIFFIFPFYWMFISAFKTPFETLQVPLTLFPKEWSLDNFIEVWQSRPMLHYLKNSLIVTVSVVSLQFITVVMAAYGLSRYPNKLNNFVFSVILLTMMIPPQVTFIPIFVDLSRMKMINTLYSLIIPFATSASGIFLVRQSFLQIPVELYEAAELDNFSELQIIFNIIVPYVKPTLITFIIMATISAWNNYFWALAMTTTDEARTLPVAISAITNSEGNVGHALSMAGNVILVFPMMILFIFARKYITKAFNFTGIK